MNLLTFGMIAKYDNLFCLDIILYSQTANYFTLESIFQSDRKTLARISILSLLDQIRSEKNAMKKKKQFLNDCIEIISITMIIIHLNKIRESDRSNI